MYNKYVEVTGTVSIRIAQYGEIQRERYSLAVEKAPRLIR
jgi:hypothetical protein